MRKHKTQPMRSEANRLFQHPFAGEFRRRQRVDQQTVRHQRVLKGHGGERRTQLSLTVRPAEAIAGEHPMDPVKLGREPHEEAQGLTDGSYHVAFAQVVPRRRFCAKTQGFGGRGADTYVDFRIGNERGPV